MSAQKDDSAKEFAVEPATNPVAEVEQKNHSTFTTTEKKILIFVASIAALFSPMSANIYMPALNTLRDAFHVTNTLINLTVTTYLVSEYLSSFCLHRIDCHLDFPRSCSNFYRRVLG
jgi:hypothetical protein